MTRERAATNFIVIYSSATPPTIDIGAADIDRRHRALGWLCNGYHWVIRRNGAAERGRDDKLVGAHEPSLNAVSVAVCLVGGVAADGKTPDFNFTDEQIMSLHGLLADLGHRYPDAAIVSGGNYPTQPERP